MDINGQLRIMIIDKQKKDDQWVLFSRLFGNNTQNLQIFDDKLIIKICHHYYRIIKHLVFVLIQI